jgi:LysR family transcriptional regulator, regulator for metE and metH
LITYPVATNRLKISTKFLTPAGISPKRHKLIETTEVMLQMVASGRGVAELPHWLVREYEDRFPIFAVRLGSEGVGKGLFLCIREADAEIGYLRALLELAHGLRDQKAAS